MKGENFKMKKTIIVGLLIMALCFWQQDAENCNDRLQWFRAKMVLARGAFIEPQHEKDADGTKLIIQPWMPISPIVLQL